MKCNVVAIYLRVDLLNQNGIEFVEYHFVHVTKIMVLFLAVIFITHFVYPLNMH